MTATTTGLASYLIIIGVALLAHEPWRWLGAYLGHTLSPDDEIFLWVRAVSTALVAGLVMRLVLYPAGVLEASPLAMRLAGFAIGVGGYFALGRNLLLGILVGCIAFGAGLGIWPIITSGV